MDLVLAHAGLVFFHFLVYTFDETLIAAGVVLAAAFVLALPIALLLSLLQRPPSRQHEKENTKIA